MTFFRPSPSEEVHETRILEYLVWLVNVGDLSDAIFFSGLQYYFAFDKKFIQYFLLWLVWDWRIGIDQTLIK